MKAKSRDLRVGVVGVGSLGFHHARILRTLSEVRMAGIFDIREERLREVAGQLEVEAAASLEALLDVVDAVVVATPTVTHEEVATAALSRGIHVLVEKPLAPDLDVADRILAAGDRGGALIQVGHVERFNSALQAAAPFLDTPLFIESHRLAPFVPRSTDVPVVLDLMIHDVDLVRTLVGSPVEEIQAAGIPIITPHVDIANARLTFQGGPVANLTASRVSVERMRKLRIFQPSGYLSLNLADGTGEFLRLKAELPVWGGGRDSLPEALERAGMEALVERIPLRGPAVEPLRLELESFRDACLGRSPPAVSGREGREALALSLAIQERIRSHVAHSCSS